MFATVRKKLNRLKNRFFAGVFYLAGLLTLLACFAVVGYQVFHYLYRGDWPHLPLRSLLSYTPYDFYSWVLAPQAWLGLHRVVEWLLGVPLAFVCFVIGYLLIKISDLVDTFSDG